MGKSPNDKNKLRQGNVSKDGHSHRGPRQLSEARTNVIDYLVPDELRFEGRG
jgi:hypothetical protein